MAPQPPQLVVGAVAVSTARALAAYMVRRARRLNAPTARLNQRGAWYGTRKDMRRVRPSAPSQSPTRMRSLLCSHQWYA